jgi:hypothetical protein
MARLNHSVVTQFESGENKLLPAPRTGVLYNVKDGFVEASPSRVLRDGEGTSGLQQRSPIFTTIDRRKRLA